MKGMIGLIINENTINNSVRVMGPAGTDAWLVKFENKPPFQKICSIAEMSTWILFGTPQELQAFIAEHEAKPEAPLAPGTPPADPPADPPLPPEDPDGTTH